MTRHALPLLLLAGCMPLGNLRPASGILEDHKFEVGGGGALVGKRPYIDEPTRGTGQVWGSMRYKEFTFSAVGAFDLEAAALGGAARWDAIRKDRFRGGLELELGFAWVGAVVPVAVRLFDQTWLYASPRLAPRVDEILFDLPVGLSVRVYDGFSVRLEGHATWVDFQYEQRRLALGVGLAYQFDRF